jgi:hypothetical protein
MNLLISLYINYFNIKLFSPFTVTSLFFINTEDYDFIHKLLAPTRTLGDGLHMYEVVHKQRSIYGTFPH